MHWRKDEHSWYSVGARSLEMAKQNNAVYLARWRQTETETVIEIIPKQNRKLKLKTMALNDLKNEE